MANANAVLSELKRWLLAGHLDNQFNMVYCSEVLMKITDIEVACELCVNEVIPEIKRGEVNG